MIQLPDELLTQRAKFDFAYNSWDAMCDVPEENINCIIPPELVIDDNNIKSILLL